uniref:Uncharacterized protein n=1 Tax=Chlamydomonas euryale TaxID=1486919 RepID=A0A7R9VID2_9CHLO
MWQTSQLALAPPLPRKRETSASGSGYVCVHMCELRVTLDSWLCEWMVGWMVMLVGWLAGWMDGWMATLDKSVVLLCREELQQAVWLSPPHALQTCSVKTGALQACSIEMGWAQTAASNRDRQEPVRRSDRG